MSIRVRDDLLAYLQREATKNRRSVSDEIRHRLNEPLRDDAVLTAIGELKSDVRYIHGELAMLQSALVDISESTSEPKYRAPAEACG